MLVEGSGCSIGEVCQTISGLQALLRLVLISRRRSLLPLHSGGSAIKNRSFKPTNAVAGSRKIAATNCGAT